MEGVQYLGYGIYKIDQYYLLFVIHLAYMYMKVQKVYVQPVQSIVWPAIPSLAPLLSFSYARNLCSSIGRGEPVDEAMPSPHCLLRHVLHTCAKGRATWITSNNYLVCTSSTRSKLALGSALILYSILGTKIKFIQDLNTCTLFMLKCTVRGRLYDDNLTWKCCV